MASRPLPQSSWFFFGHIRRQLDDLKGSDTAIVGEMHEVKALLQTLSQQFLQMGQSLVQGQADMALTMQDLQTKADAAAAANNELISMAQAQAKMLRDALAGGNSAEQQAAMQKVADTLDGLAAADTAEVAADTVSTLPSNPALEPPPADGSGAPPTP